MNFHIIVCIVLVSAWLSLSTAYAEESSTARAEESSTARAEESSKDKKAISHKVYLQGGAYLHFNDSDDHTDVPLFMSTEIHRSDQWLYGLALFNNSFGQFSQYLYGGYKFKFKNRFENYHAILTAGIIHGYSGEYQDKIPFNSSGFAPGIIPGVGWKKDKWGVDAYLLGNSGLLFTIGYDVFEF